MRHCRYTCPIAVTPSSSRPVSLTLTRFRFTSRVYSGVNFMEKTISVRRTTITFSIWDLGGQREFVNMLPLVCNDAVAILFMFDLSRKSTLNSVKEWYRQARGFNKVCTASEHSKDVANHHKPSASAFFPSCYKHVTYICSFLSRSHRQQYPSSSARNSTPSPPSPETNKKRLPSKRNGSPRRCTPRSSSARRRRR